MVSAAAFAGALLAVATVIALARASGRIDARALLLAGVVLNTATSAALSLLRSALPGTRAQRTLSLLLGAIGDESPGTVAIVSTLVVAGFVALWALSKPMDLLGLGAETAETLGVSVRKVELLVFIAGSLVVGAAVSVCGLVPFVGLVVPHYARAWIGGAHRALLPASALAGATLLVLADAAARVLFRLFATEPPVGALTALMGAPFLFVALRGRRSDLW
jgi:iron complex transport system permease protein